MDNQLLLSLLFVTLSWGFMGTFAQSNTTVATNATATTIVGGSTTPTAVVSPTTTVNSAATVGTGTTTVNSAATVGTGTTTANSAATVGTGTTTANSAATVGTGTTTANSAATVGTGNTTANSAATVGTGTTTANSAATVGTGNTTANSAATVGTGNTTANSAATVGTGNTTANSAATVGTGTTTANSAATVRTGTTTVNSATMGAGNTTNATTATAVSSTTAVQTTPIPVASLQTPVSRTNCGSTKLCAAVPSTCDPATGVGCSFISARQQSGQLYNFEASGDSSGYIATGVSTSTNVNGTQNVYICANHNGVVRFFPAIVTNLALSLTQSNASNVRGAINSRKIQCTFTATLPDTTIREASYSLSFVNGTYDAATGTFGPPNFLIFTNRVNLSDPNSNTTNQISNGAYPATYQQPLIPALLVTAAMLCFSMQ